MTDTFKFKITSPVQIQHGTFYVAVFGCQMNVYDGDRIRDLLSAQGYSEVTTPKDASVIVFVTCAVRAKAENRVFKQLETWRHQGLVKDDAVIALGGCVGSELGQKILDLNSDIHIVFGPRTVHKLPSLLSTYLGSGQRCVDVEADSLDKFDALPSPGARGASAFITIMEGCSNKCTYCIVPYTRGEEISRSPEDILKECEDFLSQDVIEIHLLGQNVNSYRGVDKNGIVCDFATLLYEIAALDGVKRIRFTTSNPMDFSDEIIRAIKELPIIADQIHVPIQAGSDRILEKMHRRYTVDSYKTLVNKIRKARPTAQISSDFIVGFPGETYEDFKQTVEAVKEIGFDQSFSFIYSPRPGTPAAKMDDPIAFSDKQKWLYELQEELEKSTARIGQSLIGTTQEVLVEGISRKDANELKARASNGRITVFKGTSDLIGQMVKVKIVGVASHTLKAERIL